jgi:hypothetical protein
MRGATTFMLFVLGAMIGATGMYLLDPEHGPRRRTRARTQLRATASQGAGSLTRAAQRASGLARQAMQRTPGPPASPTT